MKVQYNRVSHSDQSLARQISDEGVKVYADECSGSIAFKDRKFARMLLNDIERMNITEIETHSLDRLGRSLKDIISTLQLFTEMGINVISKKEGLRTLNDDGSENMVSKMMFGVLGSIAEFELNRIKERQTEGIRILKAKKGYKGRVKGSGMSSEEYLHKHRKVVRVLDAKNSLRNTAKICEVSLSTVQKVVRLSNS